MKLPYENELYELRKWIDFTNNANLQMQFLHTPQEIQRVHQWINAITMGIQADYPFYAATLPRIASILFIDSGMGAFILNQAAFGELVIIIRHIEAEPVVAPKPIAQAISQQPKSILTQPQNPVKNTPKIDLSSVKIGSMLTHKAFGAGAVKAIDDKYITVDFDGMENRFMFPAAIMQGFLKPQ